MRLRAESAVIAFAVVASLAPCGALGATVGNFVFLDLNGDGLQTGGEPGLGGVSVTLMNAGANNAIGGGDDTPAGTTSTNAAGNYSFSSVAAGTYYLIFTTPTGRAFTTIDTGADDTIDSDVNLIGYTAVFSLTAAQIDNTRDVGIVDSGEVSGMVFNDADRDGIREMGEGPISGVTVRVLNVGADMTAATGDDIQLGVETTDGNGEYSVDTGLAPGDYFVQFELPTGRLFTLADQGADDTIDSDPDVSTGLTNVFALALAQQRANIDAGMFLTASAGGEVFKDLDGDGVQDAGETGYPNVTVELFNAGADMAVGGGDDVSGGTRVSNASGSYTFADIQPGKYYLTLTVPMNAGLSPLDQGGNDTTDNDFDPATERTAVFTINAGQIDSSRDAGLFDFSEINGRVFADTDGDGVRETGEGALAANALVALYDAGANGTIGGGDDTPIATVNTTSTFSFTSIEPGTYFLTFTGPTGLGITRQDKGTDDTLDSDANTDGSTPVFTITSGQAATTRDAGFVAYATVGDLVFFDDNRDGVQQAGEDGVDNVLVSLYSPGLDGAAGGTDDELIDSVATSGGGLYSINAPPGTYYLSVALPAQRAFTARDQGADDALDSDIDPATGRTALFALLASTTNNDFDAGLLLDTDGDGVDDDSDGCPEDTGKTEPGDCGCGQVEIDTDSDGVSACIDNCPDDFNGDQTDSDGDGVGNGCDNCVNTANPTQIDSDGDGIGDACDSTPLGDAAQSADDGDDSGTDNDDDGNDSDDGDNGNNNGGNEPNDAFDPGALNCGACAPMSASAYLLTVAMYGGAILWRRRVRGDRRS